MDGRRLVLEGPLFAQFFEKVEVTNFEVASDAFATFKDLLTRHKALVGRFLASSYDQARGRAGLACLKRPLLGVSSTVQQSRQSKMGIRFVPQCDNN